MKKIQICIQCDGDYTPKRRGVQKFCSNSCRSRYWFLNTKKENDKKEESSVESNQLSVPSKEIKMEKISKAGVGNAALGVATFELAKNIFTPKEHKPATKKDIGELKSIIQGNRYLPVKNALNDGYGRQPYYDVETGNVVYINKIYF